MGNARTAACIHRWVLGEPTMDKVYGTCRRCGAQRTYPSGLEIPEAVTDYEELNPRRLLRSAPEERAAV